MHLVNLAVLIPVKAFGDAKGQPGQSNSVSHGCVPSLFQQVNIINTGRTA